MTVSHKGQVVAQFLVPISIAYLATAYIILRGSFPSAETLWDNAGGMAVLVLAAMLVQDLIPKPLKEALIFFRVRDRLPSHRSFSDKTLADPRIVVGSIERLQERKALAPREQSNDWYQAYRRVSDEESIKHYSARYLGWRDSSALSLVLAIVSVPATMAFVNRTLLGAGCALAVICLVFYLLCVIAARLASNELVTLVLVRLAVEARNG